jgi:hypothetical protein
MAKGFTGMQLVRQNNLWRTTTSKQNCMGFRMFPTQGNKCMRYQDNYLDQNITYCTYVLNSHIASHKYVQMLYELKTV